MGLKEKLNEILELKWTDEDRKDLENFINNALYYRHFISKSFENDIIRILDICMREKLELDEIKSNL